MWYHHGVAWLTEIESKPRPRMPSKCAAMKAMPGSLVTSAKEVLAARPPTETMSVDMNPEHAPLPYWIEYLVPFGR